MDVRVPPSEMQDDRDVYVAVLHREQQQLRHATGVDDLYRWRDHVVEELSRPESAYARAMSRSGATRTESQDNARYARFLGLWSTMVAETIRRLQALGTIADRHAPEDLATAILAAVHGGALLVRVTDDVRALRNALRVPLDQLHPRNDGNKPS